MSIAFGETVSEAERDALRRGLELVSPLDADDWDVLPPAQRVALAPGEVWLQAGAQAKRVGFVISGALREFYVLQDGTEKSKSFNLSGDFAGSLADLLSPAPSKTWVVAAQNTVLLAMNWTDYEHLTNTRPAWMRFARKMAERLYLQKVQREYELLALDAAQRLDAALARWPQLERHFTQQDIASYIGITPVHLSRLRSRARSSLHS